MPFQSEKQRRYLHANHPEIAKRWERDYANGGILDINESEEIISDDGNDIELTAYNAAFDDPNDLSTGVRTLFKAKDGGRIGFFTGMREQEQRQQEQTQHRERPDVLSSPVSQPSVTPTVTTTRDDKGDDARETYISEQYKTEYDKYAGTDLEEQQEIDQRDALRRLQSKNISKQERKNLEVGVGIREPDPGRGFWGTMGLLVGAYTGFAPLFGMEIGKGVRTASYILDTKKKIDKGIALYNKKFNTKYSSDKFIEDMVEKAKIEYEKRKAKMDLYNSLPDGHPEKIALSIELEIGKKPEHLGDGDGDEGPIVDPVTLEVDEEYAQGAIDPRDWMAEIRARQAIYQGLKSGWENQQLNSGGLANLFRVKNKY